MHEFDDGGRGEFLARSGDLELWHSRRNGGYRHYLDGQPVHCGTGLERAMEDGSWMPVRYETTRRRDRPERVALLCIRVRMAGRPKDGPQRDEEGVMVECTYFDPEAEIEVPSWARLRWPRERCQR